MRLRKLYCFLHGHVTLRIDHGPKGKDNENVIELTCSKRTFHSFPILAHIDWMLNMEWINLLCANVA